MWPGVTDEHERDAWGNVPLFYVEKGKKLCRNLLLCPWKRPMDHVRAGASAFPGNVHVPEGWLYVCTHCGSRSLDKFGLSSYDDGEDRYVWEQICIQNAVLVSEEEYQQGRRAYDENPHR